MKKYVPISRKKYREDYDYLGEIIIQLMLPGYCTFEILRSPDERLYYIETDNKWINAIQYIHKNFEDYKSVLKAAVKAITAYISAHNYFDRIIQFRKDKLFIKQPLNKILSYLK